VPAQVAQVYDEQSSRYDSQYASRKSRWRHRLIENSMRRLARGHGATLELGCGTGRFSRQVASEGFVGVDISLDSLSISHNQGTPVVGADAHQLPFPDSSFDVVLAPNGVFRYLNYALAFTECRRVLRPGGFLAVHQFAERTWSPRRFWTLPKPDHGLHLSAECDLHDPARAAGLRLVSSAGWRSLSVYPYAMRVPTRLPVPLWSQVVAIYCRKTDDV